jgi:polyphosphate kinase
MRTKGASAAVAQPAVAREPKPPAEVDLDDPELYLNRELSLLAFQRRVLEEAEDERNPLLERVKFLSILGSNLDEFFMVRVASLAAQLDSGSPDAGPDGMSPRAQLIAIRREVKKLLNDARKCLDKLLPSFRPKVSGSTTTPSSRKVRSDEPPNILKTPSFLS